MAIRRWAVYPPEDSFIVDRNELAQAIMDGEAALWRLGGVLTIMPQRAPTEVPGEMVTTAVIIEWKDRTDARPQPETPAAVAPQPAPAAPPAPAPPEPEAEGEVREPALVGAGGVQDGLDPSTLEDEDMSSIGG